MPPPADDGADESLIGNAAPRAPRATVLAFAVPSLLGVLAFLTPVYVGGNWNILMGYASDAIRLGLGVAMPWIVCGLLFTGALGTLIVSLLGEHRVLKDSLAARLFRVNVLWLALRWLGLVMALMTLLEFGPEFVRAPATGGTVLNDLAVQIVPIFLVAGVLMPFLTDYGLMEFVGTVLKRPFRFLFTLPGRSAIDALASWMSSAPVGVLITIQQYVYGHYTAREAAVIATNFSVVSVPFALLVANTAGLGQRFPAYYAAVVVTGVITAIILPRIPPLSRFRDAHLHAAHPLRERAGVVGEPLLREALRAATARAGHAPAPRRQLQLAAGNILDVWFGLVPAVIVVGGAGLMLAEYTPVLRWLSMPFVPVLGLLGLPEAAAAAPAMIAGFLDMFLPALLVADIQSEITRFTVAVVSVTQLIYMSEVGMLLLRSEIPLRLSHLVLIFLLRTLIGLPIAAAFAHLLL